MVALCCRGVFTAVSSRSLPTAAQHTWFVYLSHVLAPPQFLVFMPLQVKDGSGEGRVGRFCDPVTGDVLTNASRLVLLKPTGGRIRPGAHLFGLLLP